MRQTHLKRFLVPCHWPNPNADKTLAIDASSFGAARAMAAELMIGTGCQIGDITQIGYYNPTPGQLAYEADVRRYPTYHNGQPRPSWEALRPWARESWEKPQ